MFVTGTWIILGFDVDIVFDGVTFTIVIYSYLDHIRSASGSELGGGFISDIPCKRALQDAFCGLYFSMQEDAWSRQDNSGSMDIG